MKKPAAKAPEPLRERLASVQNEMDTFAYTISHDLRAPLIHIGGFVDLLLEHAGPKLDEQSRHYLQRIAESTYQMGRMVDDVLALSRLSRAEMHLIRLEVKDLIKEVMNDVRALTENRRIRWEIGELPSVVADPTLLRLALFHLVSNALRFTRRRAEAVIAITGEHRGQETIFTIRDNGIGFDPKQQAKLFGVFQRLHSANESDGTGTGLAQVQRIMQRHGGRAWGEGVPDKGATFHLAIPDGGPETA